MALTIRDGSSLSLILRDGQAQSLVTGPRNEKQQKVETTGRIKGLNTVFTGPEIRKQTKNQPTEGLPLSCSE